MELIVESTREARILREVVSARTRYVMRRVGWFVASIRIALRRENGSEPQLMCRVEILPRDGARVVVVSRARRWSEAIGAALRRAVFAVAAAIRRRRESRVLRLRPRLGVRR